jgi:hypothetical protein
MLRRHGRVSGYLLAGAYRLHERTPVSPHCFSLVIGKFCLEPLAVSCLPLQLRRVMRQRHSGDDRVVRLILEGQRVAWGDRAVPLHILNYIIAVNEY